MKTIGELVQTADWKTEKHIPVIECPATLKANELVEVKVGIGKTIAHPNTTEHHIGWISLFFLPEGDKFPHHLGRFEFAAHGASTQGPNSSSVYTHHSVTAQFKTGKSGTLLAIAFCNIHGLWQSTKALTLQ